MKQTQPSRVVFLLLALCGTWGITTLYTQAASSPVEKTVETVKEQIDTLISAKDEKKESEDTLELRVEILTKALDISLEEAKDLKSKLSEIKEDDEKKVEWIKNSITKLDEIIAYYESQRKIVEKNEFTSIEDIKTLANEIKTWREEKSKETIELIHEFFLLKEQKSAIDIAEARYAKIKTDIEKLERFKMKVGDAKKLLEKSNGKIKEGMNAWNTAYDAFWKKVIPPEKKAGEDIKILKTIETRTLASTESEKELVISTKDLVKESLGKIKETYQIFLEISNSVRKLLK